jgi:hypothetical protein
VKIKAQYHVNNIMSWVDLQPLRVIEDINAALNDPETNVHGIGPAYNLQGVSHELAYWSELNAFLIGLWGRIKHDTERTEKSRMAVRDFIYEAASAARLNWQATSRVQSSYELIAEDTKISNQRRTS